MRQPSGWVQVVLSFGGGLIVAALTFFVTPGADVAWAWRYLGIGAVICFVALLSHVRVRAVHLEVNQIAQAPLWSAGQQIYDITELWLMYQRGQADVARSITARLDFFAFYARIDEDAPRLTAHGEWALTGAPGHIAPIAMAPAIDIPRGLIPAKLLVLLKYTSEASAYVFAGENIYAYPDGRHPAFALPAGSYLLRVTLVGLNLHQVLWFEIDNVGVGQQPRIMRSLQRHR